MFRILLFSLFLQPMVSLAQTITTTYTDVEEIPYKSVVIKGRDTVVTYFDEAGQPILDVCDTAIGTLRYSLEHSLIRAISDRWKRDTTQRKRYLEFSFFLSTNGYSNVRLIDYNFGFHTPAELEAILLEVLNQFQLKTDRDCETYFQVYAIQEISYPIRAVKKDIVFVVDVRSKKELREAKQAERRKGRQAKKENAE